MLEGTRDGFEFGGFGDEDSKSIVLTGEAELLAVVGEAHLGDFMRAVVGFVEF